MAVNSLKTAKNKISLSASYEPEDGLQEGPVPGGPGLWWGQAPCTRAQGLDGKRGLAICMTLRRVLTSVLSTIQQNGGRGKPLRRTPLEVKAEAAWSLPEPRAPTRRSGQALCPLPAASPPRVTPGHLPAASVLTMPHAGNQTSRAPARPGPLPGGALFPNEVTATQPAPKPSNQAAGPRPPAPRAPKSWQWRSL